MAKVPTAVREQEEKASKLQKELAGEGKKGKDKKGKKQEATPPEPAAQGAQPAQNEPQAGEETWEQKYHTLKGKYDAEIGANVADMQATITNLQAANAELNEQLAEASRTIMALNNVIATGQTQEGVGDVTPQEEPEKPDLDPEDFVAYGDEMAKLIEYVNWQNGEINRLKQMTQQVEQHQTMTAEEKFWSELGNAVNDWEQINVDPRFLEWLNHPDPASGVRRLDLLQNHVRTHNAPGAIYFFNTWKQSVSQGSSAAVTSPASQNEQTAQQSPGQGQQAQSGLESQVMPPEAGAPTTPAGAQQVTRADIERLSAQFSRGKITEDEFNKKVNEFQKSLAAGGAAI